MIDIENQVFSRIKSAILTKYPDALVSSAYVEAPPQFPCVFIVEESNTALENTRTSSSNENHAVLMYQVDVYSAKATGKKAEAKAIASVASDAFGALGFTRAMFAPVINAADTSVYRYTARYNAIADKNDVIYRR